jgi:hypothetical protein
VVDRLGRAATSRSWGHGLLTSSRHLGTARPGRAGRERSGKAEARRRAAPGPPGPA